jgi:hypothetical protein
VTPMAQRSSFVLSGYATSLAHSAFGVRFFALARKSTRLLHVAALARAASSAPRQDAQRDHAPARATDVLTVERDALHGARNRKVC